MTPETVVTLTGIAVLSPNESEIVIVAVPAETAVTVKTVPEEAVSRTAAARVMSAGALDGETVATAASDEEAVKTPV